MPAPVAVHPCTTDAGRPDSGFHGEDGGGVFALYGLPPAFDGGGIMPMYGLPPDDEPQ